MSVEKITEQDSIESMSDGDLFMVCVDEGGKKRLKHIRKDVIENMMYKPNTLFITEDMITDDKVTITWNKKINRIVSHRPLGFLTIKVPTKVEPFTLEICNVAGCVVNTVNDDYCFDYMTSYPFHVLIQCTSEDTTDVDSWQMYDIANRIPDFALEESLQAKINNAEQSNNKNKANGYAGLDENEKIHKKNLDLYDFIENYTEIKTTEYTGMTVTGTTVEQWVELVNNFEDGSYVIRGSGNPYSVVRLPKCTNALKVFDENDSTLWSDVSTVYHLAKLDVLQYVGKSVKIYGRSRAGAYPLAFFVDENYNVLARYGTDIDTVYGYTPESTVGIAVQDAVEIDVPDNAKYVYVIGTNAYMPKIEVLTSVEYVPNEKYKHMQSPLWGKKLYVDGDSICYGNGYAGGFGKIIADKYNMELINNGVGGATISSGTMDEKKAAVYGAMDWSKSYYLRLSNYNPVTEAYEGAFSIPMTEDLYNNGHHGVAPTWYKLINGVMVEQEAQDVMPTNTKWYLKFDVPTCDGNTTEKWIAMWAHPQTDGSYTTPETTGNRWLWEAYKSGFASAHQNEYCTIGEVRHCLSTSVEEVDTTADYIIFEGGINDYLMNKGIGTITQDMTSPVDIQTMVGGLERICRYLLTSCVGKKILFVITHKAKNYPYTINNDGSSWTKATLTDYHDAIVSVLKKYSIPCVDLFNNSMFNTELTAHLPFTQWHDKSQAHDGTHPTKDGYELFYVPQIVSVMENI